jgi:hypothetical protein
LQPPAAPPSAAALRAVLRAHADPTNAAGARRYFPDGVKTYGVRRTILNRLAVETAATLRRAGAS